jgi:hypothetical protein
LTGKPEVISRRTDLRHYYRLADYSSRIGGFAERHGSTKLTPRAHPINATESERKMFRARFKSMQQGFTGTLEQHADCLAKA